MGYYSPAEILLHVSLFIPCRPRLPARAFLSIRKPLRRGAGEWRYVPLHGAGCLPVSSAWCHQTRVFSLTIIKEIIPFTSRPSAQGDSPCRNFLTHLLSDRQQLTELRCI
uniref:Uncharacterized protein n=1 Tax=Shigella dysenteriae TaxID=622 RepID=Q9FBI1_SHIDY|nr:hypothetical protein [Shigella dysenteriae]